MADLEGKIQLQADLVPTNDNPKQWVADNRHIKGAPQIFSTIADMVAFHPNVMKAGMSAEILDFPSIGVVTKFNLNRSPSALLDANGDSIVTDDNYTDYWDAVDQTALNKNRVTQYAADSVGGGSPTFPYTVGTESEWENELDVNKGHSWFRFRVDDTDSNEDGIYDGWTPPIRLGQLFNSGDYIENRFKRVVVSNTIHSSTGTLTIDKYYLVNSGTITVTGDTELEIALGVDGNGDVILTQGRKFKYKSGVTYVFNTATVIETIIAPPRSISGAPNNEPTGWTDTVPGGTDQLWQIFAQKSIYGAIKTAWQVKRINEDPDFIRYSNITTPHPDSLAGTTIPATTGSQGDTDLIAGGWVSVYNGHDFMATRSDAGGGNYTSWVIEKINEESGEYSDRVFKIFDVNLDLDDVSLVAPTGRDASQEGWNDTPLIETDLRINYTSEARKFYDGTLKTLWSKPIPYTGKDTISDIIKSDLGDNFKSNNSGAITPSQIQLTAEVYKGLSKLWENDAISISFAWKKIYDNGAVVDISPDLTFGAVGDFYTLDETGTAGQSGYKHPHQRVVVKPGGVTGKAVFQCVQTITISGGTDIVLTSEYDILDITDGKDAKSLALSADKQLVIWDTTNTVFNPALVTLRAFQSNLVSPVYKWYVDIAGTWTAIAGTEDEYTISGNKLIISCADLFTGDTSSEGFKFAVSTHATNPDSADYDTTFSDYTTISKASSNAVGTDGENAISAILDNEAHTIVLDDATGDPQAGEIGSSGKAITTLQFYDGVTKKTYGAGNDYTIGAEVAVSDAVWGTPTGETVTITSAATELPTLSAGQIFKVIDHSNANNNGLYKESGGTPTTGSITADKLTGNSPEAASAEAIITLGGIVSDNSNVLFDYAVNANSVDLDVWVEDWGTDEVSATGTLQIVYSSKTIVKRFSISSTRDALGALVLDLDASNGLSFTPNERSDKTLTAKLYDTNDDPELQSTGYDYRFKKNAVLLQDWSTDNDVVIARSTVNAYADFLVEVRKTGDTVVLRSRTVRIYDVVDGKAYRLFSTNASAPSAPADTIKPDGVGDANWSPSSANAKWAVDGEERWPITTGSDVDKYDWGTVYQIKGESGDQGDQGDFIFPMYKAGTTVSLPNSNSSTLSQMTNAGWTADVPVTSNPIWKSERRWIGQGVSFDGNGLPSTNPSTGSFWTLPVRLTGQAGDNGTNGTKTEIRFRKNTSTTAAPGLTNTSTNPSNWSITPPSRNVGESIWVTVAQKTDAGTLIGVWSTPVLWSGYDEDFRPEYYHSVGDRTKVPTDILSENNGWVFVGQITVTNDHSAARKFIVNGSVGVRNDGGIDYFAFKLTNSNGSTIYDTDYLMTDFSSVSITYLPKLRASYVTSINAGQNATFNIYVKQVACNASYFQNAGFLEAIGL